MNDLMLKKLRELGFRIRSHPSYDFGPLDTTILWKDGVKIEEYKGSPGRAIEYFFFKYRNSRDTPTEKTV